MSKTLKVLLLISFFLILTLWFNFVFATSNNEIDNSSTNTIQEDTNKQSSLSTLSPTSSSSITGVSGMNSYSQANLELNNIKIVNVMIYFGMVFVVV